MVRSIVRVGLGFGFVIWAAATVLIVPFGHFVFGPDNALPVWLASGVIIAATFAGVYWFSRVLLGRLAATRLEDGGLLAVAVCLPGLVLDGLLYAFNGGRYPGLEPAASGVMSAGLLLAYAAALLGALLAARRRVPETLRS